MEEIISFCLSTFGLIALIIASLIKGEKMKKTLILVFIGNASVGISYLFSPDGINGAVSCFIGATQTLINLIFFSKNNKTPIWLVIIYAVAFVVGNLAVLDSYIGILALLATLCFVGCVTAKSGKVFRLWQIMNNILWISYDILSRSYSPLYVHVVMCSFTIIGVFINDLNFKKKKSINS